jgi:hypothetical protein
MFILLTGIGIIGTVIFGMAGLRPGGTELERVLTVIFLAIVAAGIVGRKAERAIDGRLRPEPHLEVARRPIGGVIMTAAVAPILAMSIGVFVLTLIPSVFAMLPFLAVWWLATEGRADHTHPVPVEAPVPAPAIA